MTQLFTKPRLGELRHATVEDADHMAKVLNRDDVRECLSMGLSGLDMLRTSVENSIEAWVWIVDGEPAVMFGVTHPYLIGFAQPWCLSGRKVRDNPFPFLIGCRDFVRHIAAKYKCLESKVDGRYKLSVDWIKWMGFTIDPTPIPTGPKKAPFFNFTMVVP